MKVFSLFFLLLIIFPFSVYSQNSADIHRRNAAKLFSERNYSQAIEEVNKAIEFQPNDSYLFLFRAELNWNSKNYQGLLDDVDKAVSLNPSDKKILFFGSQMLHRFNHTNQALSLCNKLFALGEPDYFAWQLILEIKITMGNFVEAFEDSSNAIEAFPEDRRFKQTQADIISRLGDYDKSIELLTSQINQYKEKIIAEKNNKKKEILKEDLSQVFLSRSRIHFRYFYKEKALSDLDLAVETYPTYKIYAQRGRHYINYKMPENALPDLNKAIELNKDNPDFSNFMVRADLYYKMGKYAEAIEDFEQVIKIAPDFKESMQRNISAARKKLEESLNKPK